MPNAVDFDDRRQPTAAFLMNDITQLLASVARGESQPSADLLPVVYAELRKLAASWLATEAPGQTLQPTALVHEAYLRLVGGANNPLWDSRGHFFAAAAQAMRRILVESARKRNSQKSGKGKPPVELPDVATEPETDTIDLLDLNAAMEKLAQQDERKARLVELRFFGGLTTEEAAAVVGISAATAYREWAYTRAWLHREVSGEKPAKNL